MLTKNQNNNRLNAHEYFAQSKNRKLKLVSRDLSKSNSKNKGINLTKNFRKKFQDLYHEPIFSENNRNQVIARSPPTYSQVPNPLTYLEVSLNFKFNEKGEIPETSKLHFNQYNKYMITTCNTLPSDSCFSLENNQNKFNLDPTPKQQKQRSKKLIFVPIQHNSFHNNNKPKSAPLTTSIPPIFTQVNLVNLKIQNRVIKPSQIGYTPLVQSLKEKPKKSKLMNLDNISEKESIMVRDSRMLQTIQQMGKRKRKISQEQYFYKNFLEKYYQ